MARWSRIRASANRGGMEMHTVVGFTSLLGGDQARFIYNKKNDQHKGKLIHVVETATANDSQDDCSTGITLLVNRQNDGKYRMEVSLLPF
jgi:hypothetical protein